MDNEQSSSLLDSIANIGAAAVGTLKSGIAAIATTIGLTAGNGDGKEIEQMHVTVQPYKFVRRGYYDAPAKDIASCKEQARISGLAWTLKAGQTYEDQAICRPDPDSPDFDPKAQSVNLKILRTGEADPVVTEVPQQQPTAPRATSEAPKR